MNDPTLPLDVTGKHPMWTPPKPEERLTMPVRGLRVEIAHLLTPHDGREPRMEHLLGFCRDAYTASLIPEVHQLWLIGAVVMAKVRRQREIEAIKRNLGRDPRARSTMSLNHEAETIERCCNLLIAAMVEGIQ